MLYLGNRGGKILHTVGIYYLWLAFMYFFAAQLHQSLLIYLPVLCLLAIALLLRLIVIFKGKRTQT